MTRTPQDTPALLRVYLLGAFRLERNGQTRRLPMRKAESLLAYLVLHPESHSREKLAALLWGDASDEQARTSLRTALAAIRKELGDDVLIADRETVQLNPVLPLWVDARTIFDLQFSIADSEIENLKSKIGNYAGDLLPDLYDDWIAPERERLRRFYIDALLQLAQQYRAKSEYPRAIELAQKALAHDAANEKAHQQLIFCFAAAGNRTSALEQYRKCKRALQDELGVEPSSETTALYEKIRSEESGNKSPEALLSNLPIPLTSFIGRKADIAQVKQLIETTRLLTLTGAGGCGKTRLAIQVATDFAIAERFQRGVWWVELAGLNDPALVMQSVAMVFGLSESPGMPLLSVLINYLRAKELLLVVDNCEHLLGACAQLIGTLLGACPRLQIVATSREGLNISGETIWRVPSLASPPLDAERLPSLNQLRQYDAVQLFAERAQAVAMSWRLVENIAPTVQVCSRLDGIPLAIELAAARLKILSAREIAARLDDRFTLLTGGSRTDLPRHQTLRATMDWSFDLLSDAERALLRRLSVFDGGFSLEAIESVCSIQHSVFSRPNTESCTPSILDLLTSLIDKSLVVVESHDNETRYRLLETVRQYAREKLSAANEAEMIRARHLDFFAKLCGDAERELKGSDAKEWMDRLETEYDNIRAVFEYAMVNNVAAAVRLARSLVMFWVWRGYLIEGRDLILQLLARPELQGANRLRLDALKTIGCLQVYLNDSVTVRTYFEEGLSLARMLGDESDIAFTLQGMGRALILLSAYPAARPFIEASLALYRKIGEQWGEAHSLHSLGATVYQLGEHDHGQALLEESVDVFQAIGDNCGRSESLVPLGRFARNRGDYACAIALFNESLEIDRRMEYRIHIALAMLGLGLTLLQQGDYRRAVEVYTQVLEVLRRRGSPTMFVQWLIAIAQISREFAKPTAAARLLGAADAVFDPFRVKGFSMPVTHEFHTRISNIVRAELGEETFAQHWKVGRAMCLEQAIEYALEQGL